MLTHQNLDYPRLENGNSYQSHGIGDLRDDDLKGLDALLVAEVIPSILFQPGLGFVSREAGQDVGIKLGGQLLVREGMGRTAQGLVGLA
jgi:hypothetical protein